MAGPPREPVALCALVALPLTWPGATEDFEGERTAADLRGLTLTRAQRKALAEAAPRDGGVAGS